MQDDTLPRFMQEQLDAIRLIQERYAWFLDGIFAGKPFEKDVYKRQGHVSVLQHLHGNNFRGCGRRARRRDGGPQVRVLHRLDRCV